MFQIAIKPKAFWFQQTPIKAVEKCRILQKRAMKASRQSCNHYSGVNIVDLEEISHTNHLSVIIVRFA